MGEEVVSKSWYTKYRPTTMEEYAGDRFKNIVKQRFRKREDMPHVIMIQGTRGCGKTTAARILTKYYQCLSPKEDGSPCEECEACKEINEILISGESGVECPGVTEVDATIMNGKDDIQSVLEEASIAPMYTNYKILILDEVHMVSVAAQNSMLKIVEDIPSHLVIIFATTNPEKVLQTIKSRCQLTLEAKKQTIKDMVDRLLVISEKENLEVSRKALEIIAKKGDRVPRECINLLENIAKNYDGKVDIASVQDYIGDIGTEKYIQFFNAANSGLADIMQLVNTLRLEDIKIGEYIDALMVFVLDAIYIKHGINADEFTPDYVNNIKELFKFYESQDFDMLLQVLETASRSISLDNERKNEVTLVIAAMRVGKIKLLASGLAEEQEHAVAENRISMYEHSKLINKDHSNVSEQLKMAINPGMIKDTFSNATLVSEKIDIFPKVDLSEMHSVEKKNIEEKEDTSNINSKIDDFFSDK